ncbi:MAG: hypothetical protein ACK4K4_03740, partial [Caldimicrobium sp.]
MAEEIKSAWEIALEKAEKIGKASKEELEWEKQKERALILVGKFLRGESQNFKEEVEIFLRDIPEKNKKKILKVIMEALLKNLVLPREEYHLKEIKDLLKALRDFFINIPQIDKLFQETEKMLTEYYHQKEAIYQEMVRRFSEGISALEKAVSEQLGAQVKLSPESHPQFQEEWKKIKDHLDKEYSRQLEYIKALFLK